MANRDDERNSPAQQSDYTTREEDRVRSGGDEPDETADDSEDEFEDTEDLNDEEEEGEGSF